MAVTEYHLLADGVSHVVYREFVVLGRDLRVHYHLQKQIAQLVVQVIPVLSVNALQHLVALLQQRTAQAFVRLFPVPGAAVGRAEFAHHLD